MAECVSELSAEDECTCLSTLPLFIEQNHVAASAATVLGVEHVTDILTGVVCDRWLKVMRGICLTSSLRLINSRLQSSAFTQNTAPPPVPVQTPADSRA